MPTYSYACEACGKSFEIEQRISEDPIKKCVLCGKAKARRQITSGNFILKGGGWYSDGYGASRSASSSSSSAPKAEKTESVKPPASKPASSSTAD
ncbi:MAG TPA: zinc ribbon domain-containing protein [Polyangiales bacterium]